MSAVDTSTRPTQQPASEPARPKTRRRRLVSTPYILVLPTLVVLAALLGYPLVRMVILSFQDLTLRQLWSGTNPPFVGLENYTSTLTNPFFWTVVLRTVVVAAACVILSVGLGLLLALLMRRVSPWVRIVMVISMMLVWSLPQLVSTQLVAWMVDADWGVVNWMVDQIPGVDFTNHSWFADPWQGWTVIVGLVVWGAVPFLAISLYAGMTQVPTELIEAAVVDGAGPWAVFRNVTLPILRPLLVIVTTLSVIWDMGLFTQVWIMRGTKPELDYFNLPVYAFVEGFGRNNYSQGSAIAIVTVLLMVGVMIFYTRQMFKIGEAD